jgi:hypothetical protein
VERETVRGFARELRELQFIPPDPKAGEEGDPGVLVNHGTES